MLAAHQMFLFSIFDKKPEYLTAQEARKLCKVKVTRDRNAKKRIIKWLLDNESSFKVEYTTHGNPKPKYYDEQLDLLEDKVTYIRQELVNLPEIRHYEDDLKSLREELWEIKTTTIPDFKWIGNTFDVVHENFETLQGNLGNVKDKLDQDLQNLAEDLDTKDFEKRVEIKELKENLEEVLEELKEKLEDPLLKKVWVWEKLLV